MTTTHTFPERTPLPRACESIDAIVPTVGGAVYAVSPTLSLLLHVLEDGRCGASIAALAEGYHLAIGVAFGVGGTNSEAIVAAMADLRTGQQAVTQSGDDLAELAGLCAEGSAPCERCDEVAVCHLGMCPPCDEHRDSVRAEQDAYRSACERG